MFQAVTCLSWVSAASRAAGRAHTHAKVMEDKGILSSQRNARQTHGTVPDRGASLLHSLCERRGKERHREQDGDRPRSRGNLELDKVVFFFKWEKT